MNYTPTEVLEDRFILVTPNDHDAADARHVLTQDGFCLTVVLDLRACCDEMKRGCGGLLIAEESMGGDDVDELLATLREQSTWSDVPIILLTGRQEMTDGAAHFLNLFENSANVTILERPFRVNTLVSTMRAALRGRHRQYLVRELLDQLEIEKNKLEQRVEERTGELNRAVRFLEQFTYSMAHDLRAPLRSIRAFSATVKTDYNHALDPEGRRMLDRIEGAAKRMDSLITDLLALARLSNQQVPLTSISLSNVIESVIYSVDDQIQKSDLEIYHERSELRAWANPVLLKQVLENYVGNAIKYARRPDRKLIIRIFAEQRNECVRVNVQDNGPGIAPEYREKIFQPFQRLHGSEIPGSGVGLAIARQGAERMHGSVGVDSEVGEGSCFWISLPSSCELDFANARERRAA